jgi:hypothetical protein
LLLDGPLLAVQVSLHGGEAFHNGLHTLPKLGAGASILLVPALLPAFCPWPWGALAASPIG